jgi:hypothetical protein
MLHAGWQRQQPAEAGHGAPALGGRAQQGRGVVQALAAPAQRGVASRARPARDLWQDLIRQIEQWEGVGGACVQGGWLGQQGCRSW